jgi:predicted kinase
MARELAGQIGAVYLRIDSIEQAIRDSATGRQSLDDVGYRVAYALAEDNLRIGRTVIADSVNPLRLTRDAWVSVAKHARVRAVEIEVTCSVPEEHRRRVEARAADLPGMKMPTWADVVAKMSVLRIPALIAALRIPALIAAPRTGVHSMCPLIRHR